MRVYYFLILVLCAGCGSVDSNFFSSEASHLRQKYEAKSKRLMISSQGGFSSNAGLEVSKLGGNIIDVFTAVSFAISVERPQSTGIGGGGFLLYFDPKTMAEPISFDFREMAPLKSSSTMYLDKNGDEVPLKSRVGMDAAGIPGFVDGVLTVHQKYGKLPLSTVLKPAIRLAAEGFIVYPELAKALKYKKSDLGMFPTSKKIFFKNNGEVLKQGDLLVQSDLAKTIKLIAKKGKAGFYRGFVKNEILNASKIYGSGFMTSKDFDSYITKQRPPVKGTYKGYPIFSMGPPSSGGIHVIQILNILENFNLKNPQGSFEVHAMSTAMMQAFYDRAKYLGDSDFVDVPISGLTSKNYAKSLSEKIKSLMALDRKNDPRNPFKYESDETTHFSIMDNEGRVVVSTQTINGYFGSSVVAGKTGIVMNNEMDDFATKVGASNLFGAIGGKNNLVSPKKRPLSSMSPTIVLAKDSKRPLLA